MKSRIHLNKKVLLRECKRHTACHVDLPWPGRYPTLTKGYLPWLGYLPWPAGTHFGQGGTYLGWRGTYLGWGVPTLVGGIPTLAGGYLPWLGGTYLGWGIRTLAEVG